MVAVERVISRHEDESQLLSRALEGDAQAANLVIQHLSSTHADERQVMQETMHDLMDINLCSHLLSCLALQRWGDHRDCDMRADPQASERIDEAVIRVLVEDEYEWEASIKDAVLQEALEKPEAQIHQAAAVLLGLRGDVGMIPGLGRTIDEGKSVWKLRAMQALEALNDERCAPFLIKALTFERDIYHRTAVKVLRSLGEKAETAWQQALHDPDDRVRWHAAKGLGELGDARAAHILAEGVFDEASAVRWASVEILTQLGSGTVPAILTVLSSKAHLGQARQAVFQVLKGASFNNPKDQARLQPLLECLHMPDSSVEAPAMAGRLLREWGESL